MDNAAFKRFEEFLGLQEDSQLEKGLKISELDGDIEIKNLSFNYGDRSIFKDLNLTIRKGEKIAFVGESGSGKSTLVKLISGLIKYDIGSIKVGEYELKEICLNSLYSHLSYVSQESPVFDGTLRENLIFDKPVPEQEQIEALERAGLKPLLKDMPSGLETEIGERGTVISGGERQRLALARLWFEKKEITILDEATSAMDNLTEESVMEEVIRLLENRTVIAIAHRLNSVVNFDRIVVFNKGKIVGQGTFEELMQNNEYFIGLYNASVK